MTGVRVLSPEDIAPGQLILRVYGDPALQVDDGCLSSTGEGPLLPLSLVSSVSHPDPDLYIAHLACGSEVPLPADGRAEVVTR